MGNTININNLWKGKEYFVNDKSLGIVGEWKFLYKYCITKEEKPNLFEVVFSCDYNDELYKAIKSDNPDLYIITEEICNFIPKDSSDILETRPNLLELHLCYNNLIEDFRSKKDHERFVCITLPSNSDKYTFKEITNNYYNDHYNNCR